jgi:hypothetical protein
MENTKITFLVLPTSPGAELGFETWLDNQMVFSVDHVRQNTEISVPVIDDENDHVLKLVLKGKLPEHTTIGPTGEIVSDAMLEIRNLSFDDISLGHMFYEQAVYTHDFNGTDAKTQHDFFGHMGCNGTVELKFSTPVYLWLLEHM